MTATELKHPSIADIPEDKLVERLLSDPGWATEMFELYGNPQRTLKETRVPLPNGFDGDADIILFSPQHPDEAVAFEVKRIKFGISALRSGGEPNKLHEYQKAVEQANRLYDVGFWKVYLYAITVVDAREQNAPKLNSGRLVFDGLSMELRSLVASVVSTNGLNSNIGLCDLDFTQTMDEEPFVIGTHGLRLVRRSTEQIQMQEFTKWVTEVFSKRRLLA
jgi:hypothetical protein